MPSGKAFVGRVLDLGQGSWEHCRFNGCVLICNSPADYLRLKNCEFTACLLQGDGWPDYLKNRMNGPYLEQLAAKGERQ